jgi:hypothetical protein
MVPLIAFVLFGLYVRRQAERIRANDRRQRVRVNLKLAGDGMATPEELHVRHALEDEIERRRIGSVTDAGSGFGWADFQVAVDDTERAAEQIRALIDERGISGAVVEVPTTAR